MSNNKIENKSGWLISSGVFASLIASVCCIGPLVLTLLGISGAAALNKFEVLRVPMIIAVVVFFGIAGISLYRKRNSCEIGSLCADPKKFKKMVVFYWIGLVISVLGITSPQWVAWIF